MTIPDNLTLVAGDGIPVAVPSFGMVFHTDRRFTEIPAAVLDLFGRFRAQVPAEELRWYATENMSKHKAVSKRTLDMLATWLAPDAPPRQYVMLEVKNGTTYNAAGDIRCTVYGFEPGSPGFEVGDSSTISMAFPVEWGESRTGDMLQFFLDACARFPFRSARAGYAFEWSRYAGSVSQPHVWLMSMRHRGLDIAWPSLEGSTAKRDSIRGIGWLTALGEEFLERLGGRARLKAQVKGPVELIEVNGGVVLKAGPAPQFGDTEANDYLPAYQQVYRALLPLIEPMVERHPSFSLRKDRYPNTEAWIRRYAT
jgi:hypothetical protein